MNEQTVVKVKVMQHWSTAPETEPDPAHQYDALFTVFFDGEEVDWGQFALDGSDDEKVKKSLGLVGLKLLRRVRRSLEFEVQQSALNEARRELTSRLSQD